MKISLEELQELQGYLEMAKELAPIADDVVETIFVFGPAIKKVLGAIFDWQTQTTIDAVKKYMDELNCPRSEAILLAISAKQAAKELISIAYNSNK